MNRIFLIGCARSGTTLLQSLLAAHPSIISFPESHFFRNLRPKAKWRWHLGLAHPSIRDQLIDFYNQIGHEDGICVTPGPFTCRMQAYTQAFASTLDNIARQQQASCWIEKTPIHLHDISLIERYVPDATFIHLLRDGRDVLASMYEVTHKYPEVWGGARSVEQCLERWVGDIARSQRWMGTPGHHIVLYRDVAKNPEETLYSLCSALGIVYTDTMIEKYRQEAQAVSLDFERWKQSNTKSIEYKSRDKFERLFDVGEKAHIEDVVSECDWKSLSTI